MARSIPTVILCGGRGTRISEVSKVLPKPLLPVGNRPILWHIMKIYATHGYTDFILALGWLGEEIRRFFLEYYALTCDFTIELGKPDGIEYLDTHGEDDWRVTCLDTGLDSLTGTRVRRATQHLPDGPIMVTYGDGVGDVDVQALTEFHHSHGRLATVTAVRAPGRFGGLALGPSGVVTDFTEKPLMDAGSINGGFMVLEKAAIERYIPADDDVALEHEPMAALARDRQLVAYEHTGFWQPMDTPREQQLLEEHWRSGRAPWKIWA